jgi:hypothetical protein
MTERAFDDLAKRLSAATTRRGLLKGALAVALGGLATRLRGDGADAAARPACMRLGQTCDATHACCAHLACADGSCCRPTNETCYADADCCADDVCRPNPHGLGLRCLPPGDVGAACVEQTDCADGLTCDAASGLCLVATGLPCDQDSDCVSGSCDPYTGLCAGDCLASGSCSGGRVCLSNGSCAHPCPGGGVDCESCSLVRCIGTSDGNVCSADNTFGSCSTNADCPIGSACSGSVCEHLC